MTNQMAIEKWLPEKVPTIEFECMDFPCDSEAFYDCYFLTQKESEDAHRIFSLLQKCLENMGQIKFSVDIVDNQLNPINIL